MADKLAPEIWHARLAKVTGSLSFAITKKHLKRSALSHWTSELDAVAQEMDALMKSAAAKEA